MRCRLCGNKASEAIELCVNCIRTKDESVEIAEIVHKRIREKYGLPGTPPRGGSITCRLCANECSMEEGGKSYCGIRLNSSGKMESLVSAKIALVHCYFDPIPTNCCAAWFCNATPGKVNLATFFYGCCFDCLFCQNYSHKEIERAPSLTRSEFLSAALGERVHCICYFGGTPEPHFPFALSVSKSVVEEKEGKTRICWEWNGIGNPKLVRKAASFSFQSGGIIKFDLKAFTPSLSIALSGVSNRMAFENFRNIAMEFFDPSKPVLTATTLLVPWYVDALEVGNIAKFISSLDYRIPYSLLVFHPDFLMRDLPVTPRKQVEECYRAARKYLKNVNIGNRHLLL